MTRYTRFFCGIFAKCLILRLYKTRSNQTISPYQHRQFPVTVVERTNSLVRYVLTIPKRKMDKLFAFCVLLIGFNIEDTTGASISIPCEPPIIENGIVKTAVPESGVYNVGKRIRIRCDSGFDMHGSIPTCQADGTWKILPTCVERGSTKIVERSNSKTCQNPFDSKNGASPSPKKDYYNPGDVVTLTCDDGFVPSINNFTYTCDKHGQFPGDIATCIPLSCGLASPPDHLVIENYKPKYMYKEVVKYSCEWGYKLQSSSTSSRCEKNGRISPKLPKCIKIYCKKPKVGERLKFYPVADVYELAEFVAFKCGIGYFMKDDVVVLKCTESGKFSGPFPTCSGSGTLPGGVTCDFPKAPKNGRIVENAGIYHEGQTIHYECKDGFEIEGAKSSKCQPDGTFLPKVPECKGIKCSPPPDVMNGYYKMEDSEHKYQSEVEYLCNDGYQVDGNKFLTCGKSGEYTPSPPRCEKITSCYPPIIPRNGKIVPDTSENPIGKEIIYLCEAGYVLAGDAEAICLKNGQFYPDGQKCEEESVCTDPIIENGSTFRGRTVGDVGKIMYACDKGFELAGPKTSTCVNGKYEPSPPLCIPVICIIPSPLPEHVELIAEKPVLFVGERILFLCPKGYTLKGKPRATCEENGLFSSLPDKCEADKPSCKERCIFEKGAECQCDYYCSFYGNCCEDHKQHCESFELR
ncbi:complement component receptor 1-like protein [Styela clava]